MSARKSCFPVLYADSALSSVCSACGMTDSRLSISLSLALSTFSKASLTSEAIILIIFSRSLCASLIFASARMVPEEILPWDHGAMGTVAPIIRLQSSLDCIICLYIPRIMKSGKYSFCPATRSACCISIPVCIDLSSGRFFSAIAINALNSRAGKFGSISGIYPISMVTGLLQSALSIPSMDFRS